MQFNHTISAILRGRWMLDKQWALEHLPMVMLLLQGGNVNFVQQTKQSVPGSGYEMEGAYAIDPATMQRQKLSIYNYASNSFIPNPNIAPNSVGIMPILGPCTKYNGSCGEPGMEARATALSDLLSRNNIGSVVQILDTPGGEARAANSYVSVLKNSKKPIISYANGMVASLGVWFSSATKEFYLSNEMDQVGSIGSYCTLLDFSGYLEQQGIKMVEIYAPQSTEKNGDYRAALAGDTAAIEADLKMHVDAFINHVSDSRGDLAKSNVTNWNSGKMFYANDSKKMGLSDGVKPFDQVVSKAAWLAKRNKN